VLKRQNIYWVFEHYLRFSRDLSLDKLSDYLVIFSSPKPALAAGKAGAK